MKALRPIKGSKSKTKKVKQVKFATADIESYKWTQFLVIGFYDGHNTQFHYFSSLSKFLDFVFSYCEPNEINNIFCHFGGKFDFSFIMEESCFNDDYVIDSIIPRGSGFLSFDVFKSDPHDLTHEGDPFTITFRDSSALLPFALRTLAKTFQVPMQKGDTDFTWIGPAWRNQEYVTKLLADKERYEVFYGDKRIRKYNPARHKDYKKITYLDKKEDKKYHYHQKDDVLHYLKGDCISQWQVIDKFYKWPLVQSSGLCFTTASQAIKIWRTFLTKKVYSIPGHVDKFVRQGYFGGRTEIFKPYFDSKYNTQKNPHKFGRFGIKNLKKQKNKEMFYIDVNSLYPTVMKDHDYPIQFKGWVFREHYNKNSLAFWECEVTVPEMFCPPLGVKHEFADGTEKFIFPTGTFKGIWCTHELEYAKSLGVKVNRIFRGAMFENGGKIFKPFIETLYEMRLKAKEEGDSTSDLLTKLIMNSTYGRLGLNIERTNLVIDEGQMGLKPHSEVTRNGQTIRFAEKPICLEDSFTNVAISAYVTAYSRILMHSEIYMVAGEDHLYYTDTDSAFTTKPLKYFDVGKELGQLKLEYKCKTACFLLPKTYINDGVTGESFKKKLTMKGFDKKKIKHFTMEDFTFALKGDLKRLKIYQEPKFATLKTALMKGKFVTMNFDPKVSKKNDKDRLLGLTEVLKNMEVPRIPDTDTHGNRISKIEKMAIIEQHSLEVEKIEKKIKNLTKRLKDDKYGVSERGIKSQYDKRVIIEEGFKTKPIHLTKE